MAMKSDVSKVFLFVTIIALTSLTFSGCGKNVMGPTAPEAVIAQAAAANGAVVAVDALTSGSEAASGTVAAEGQVTAACFKKGRQSQWSHRMFQQYAGLLNYLFIRYFSKYLALKWFEDQDLYNTVKRIVHSPLFFEIYVRCGVGEVLSMKVLQILSDTWYPGIGTNPSGCEPEITLLPYRWKKGPGFYGERIPGWGNGDGYHLEARTPELDYVFLDTNSSVVNIYQNETPIVEYRWKYGYQPYEGNPGVAQMISLKIINAAWEHKLRIPGGTYETRIREDEQVIFAEEVWASTEDKSGRCKITSLNTDLINLDLIFAADGTGGGTLDIKRSNGQIDHYEFTVDGSGHGHCHHGHGGHGHGGHGQGHSHHF